MSLYYSISDYTISLANDDCGGLSIIEALICGSIPIVNRLETHNDFLNENVNCFYINNINTYELSNKILNVHLDKLLKNNLNIDKLFYSENYDIKNTMKKMNDIYKIAFKKS